jgi:hypothetical protein
MRDNVNGAGNRRRQHIQLRPMKQKNTAGTVLIREIAGRCARR